MGFGECFRSLFIEVMLEFVKQLVVHAVVFPKPLFFAVHDAAVHKQLHVIRESGLAAFEMFEDLESAHIVLAQHIEYLHPICIAERFTNADIGLFLHR